MENIRKESILKRFINKIKDLKDLYRIDEVDIDDVVEESVNQNIEGLNFGKLSAETMLEEKKKVNAENSIEKILKSSSKGDRKIENKSRDDIQNSIEQDQDEMQL